ncbi:MAG: hypothetical protein EXR58_02365 [Chloroflexi bacterium]|nr:hypothetical protein [Chloroflexota bacterium]
MLNAPLRGRVALLLSVASLLLLPPSHLHAENEPATADFWLASREFVSEDSAIVLLDDAGFLMLSPDAPSSLSYFPHSQFAMVESIPYQLPWPAALGGLTLDAELPDGTDVQIESRGVRGGLWTLWEPLDSLNELDGVVMLQTRLTLLSSSDGLSPRIRGVYGSARAAVAGVTASSTEAQFGPPTVTVWATREGLVGQTTANGHVITEHDRFVALPSRRALNGLDRRDYVVRLEYHGRTAEAPVWDIGPWNIRDDYWNDKRESFPDLPRWTPESEAAFFREYNNGRDSFGRYVTIPTSIDLADGTFWDDLQMGANDWIKVTFLWVDAPSPPARMTPLVVPKTPPRTEPVAPVVAAPPPPAASSGAILSASPNPVPAGSTSGTTTVNWDTGDGSMGQVYVWQKGGGEVPFGQGGKGALPAPWIHTGWTYEFRLYQGTAKLNRLRTLTVTGSSATTLVVPTVAPVVLPAPVVSDAINAVPSAVQQAEASAISGLADAPWIAAAPDGNGGTTVSWSTANNGQGQVYVWQPGGSEVPFAQAASGFTSVGWLQKGWQYEFRLYQGASRLQAVALNGSPLAAVRSPVSDEGRAALTARASVDPDSGLILTTIAWDTGSGAIGQVYVRDEGGNDELFAQGPVGARNVPGLSPGSTYSFALYAGTDHSNLLASVPVTAPLTDASADLFPMPDAA